MKKLLFILLIGLASLPASAKKNIYESFDIYNLESDSKVKKSYFSFELGIGSEFEMGFRFQRNFGKYFAWDVFGMKYALDYTTNEDDSNIHELTLETGVRGYTPTFGSGKIKGFVSFDVGYGFSSYEYEYGGGGYYYYYGADEKRETNSHFAMDLTIGLQFNDKFYVGYGFGNLTGDRGHSDHMVRFGLNF